MRRLLLLALFSMVLLTSCGDKNNTITNPVIESTWEIAIGTGADERAFDAVRSSSGGFIIGGQRGLRGDSDVLLGKIDGSGSTVWERTFGGIDEDVVYGVAEAPNGGIYAAGKTKRTIDPDTSAYLIHTDDTGHVVWETRLGGAGEDEGHDVVALPDNGCVIVGTIENKFFGSYNMFAARYSEDGTRVWEQEYGGDLVEIGLSCAATSDGGFVISGSTTAFGEGQHQAYVVKVGSDGAYQWDWVLDSAYISVANAIVETSDDGYLIGGYIMRTQTDHDAFVLKLDFSRGVAWMQVLGQNGSGYDDDCYAVAEVSPYVYAAVGRTSSFGAEIEDAFLTQFHQDGVQIGTILYGEHSFDEAYAVDVLPGGGFLLAGATRSIGAGGMDIYLIRTDSDGEL